MVGRLWALPGLRWWLLVLMGPADVLVRRGDFVIDRFSKLPQQVWEFHIVAWLWGVADPQGVRTLICEDEQGG